MGDLREELQAIYDAHGQLTPALVVAAARAETHPLHNRFEWDDRVAAEKWRVEQARELIHAVRVVYTRRDGTESDVRAFHCVRGLDGSVYEPVQKIAADPMLSQMLLRDMERDWRAFKARYERYDEFRRLVADEAALLGEAV